MPDAALDEADIALLDRLAVRIVELRLETPAILTLESARPVALLASSSMTFFEPFVQSLFRMPEYRRFTELAGRREALDELTRRIEAHADARDAAREKK